ncbi:hypothetical protein, partial [Aeromonas jandaei]|uniref:hypothetical protein n=1 Tax=Aeromonas jandaei TaxID=650 RepID=UPI002AA0CD94
MSAKDGPSSVFSDFYVIKGLASVVVEILFCKLQKMGAVRGSDLHFALHFEDETNADRLFARREGLPPRGIQERVQG